MTFSGFEDGGDTVVHIGEVVGPGNTATLASTCPSPTRTAGTAPSPRPRSGPVTSAPRTEPRSERPEHAQRAPHGGGHRGVMAATAKVITVGITGAALAATVGFTVAHTTGDSTSTASSSTVSGTGSTTSTGTTTTLGTSSGGAVDASSGGS